MKIYTKTGDRGETGLFGGTRVSKASDRVDAYGDVDELNSVIGVARVQLEHSRLDASLHGIQSLLFSVGAELASTPDKKAKLGIPLIEEDDVVRLETLIDELEVDLAPLKVFILPGGCAAAAQLHVARTVCRRAERKLVGLAATDSVRDELIRYLNRLSDLLFTMARHANHQKKVEDVPWKARDDKHT